MSLLLSYLSTSTEEEATQMLPAFYANLDPSRLPDEDHFDTESSSPETKNDIFRAYHSLTRFIHLYRKHLPGIPPQSEEKCCLDFLMFATPGVRFIVAKTWPYASRVKDPKRREVVFTHLGYFLADKSTAEPAAMAEFIEGAGGSYAALAALVVDHHFLSVIPDTGTVMDFMEMCQAYGSVLGVANVVLSSPVSRRQTLQQFWCSCLAYVEPGFLLYCFTVLIFSLIMAYSVAARHKRINPLMYISIASFVGGVSVMFVKDMKAYTTWSYYSLRVYAPLLYGPATTSGSGDG
ncbi:hypothetical protein B0H13DRAFT_2331341 [Mycena leptocephala]|nr:hypothetical protein B0H13DRAFT_2331341 [Mycena leptocephala]